MDSNAPLLRVTGIRKAFPGVVAVRSADLELRSGGIHALVGANGAGKSTLVKILTGVHQPDAGVMFLCGRQTTFHSAGDSMASGLAAIFQEFSLVRSLSIRDNLFLGSERARAGFINAREERRRAESVLARIGLDQSPDARVGDLSVANQQLVEIARALLRDARILLLDEPTASLSPREVARLFPILRELAGGGIGILFISHRLEEVLAIASRVTVMRDGQTLETKPVAGLTRDRLIEQMVGFPIAQEYPERTATTRPPMFEVRGLNGSGARDVSFTVGRGEVLGLAGLVGAGRTELAELIFGARRRDGGTVLIDGRALSIDSPHDAVREGIGFLTEDRKSQGLVLKASAQFNFALGNLGSWSSYGWIHKRIERSRFGSRAEALGLRLTGPEQPAAQLSGGNQQKLLVARWLEKECRFLIFDEPTRGIDVGAKREMYFLVRALADSGKAVIVISSEFPELLGLCDRIIVMRRGRIAGTIANVSLATQETIMAMAV